MDTRMIVFTLLCVTGLVLVTGQGYGGRGDDGRGGGGGGDGGRGGGGFLGGRRGGGRGGGGRGGGGRGGGGRGGGRCGPVCKIFCEHGNVPDANGCPTCRCNPPPILTCRNGEWNGIMCTPNLPNTRCGLGASCETTNSGKGICCSYPRPKIQCPLGSQRTPQTCSPMLPNNNQCRGKHDFCQGGPADGGVCCRPNVSPGTCPPPSARLGICVVGPNHCTNDNQCGVNQKCCSEGCGRECKYVGNQYPPIPPNPTY